MATRKELDGADMVEKKSKANTSNWSEKCKRFITLRRIDETMHTQRLSLGIDQIARNANANNINPIEIMKRRTRTFLLRQLFKQCTKVAA